VADNQCFDIAIWFEKEGGFCQMKKGRSSGGEFFFEMIGDKQAKGSVR